MWIAFPVGILISAIVTALGIGGGILWMPFLLIVLGLTPEKAVLTSMLIQTCGKGSGAFAYYRQRLVDLRLALILLVVCIPSITIGAYLANTIRPSQIELILGVLMMLNAFSFVTYSQTCTDDQSLSVGKKNYRHLSVMAAIVSLTSGMLSTGIGEWLIPIMRSRSFMTMRNAIATSIFITFGICVIGAGVHLIIGAEANMAVVRWAIPGVIAGGQIGPRITKRIPERLLKESFVFLLTLVGIHLVYNAY